MSRILRKLRALFGRGSGGGGGRRETRSRDRGAERDDSGALESLVHVLRSYGRHFPDVAEIEADDNRDACEGWSRHVLTGASPPGREPGASDSPAGGRDWPRLREAFSEIRRGEQKVVSTSFRDLRHAFWAFTRGLAAAIRKDQSGDKVVKTQLGRLRRAVRDSSIDEIKREALAVAETVGQIIEERQTRQRIQMAELGDKMRELNRELEDARAKLAIDPLTRLFNRAAFDEQLERLINVNTISGRPACLLLIDFDHFKKINDTQGHTAGDEVLRQVADCTVRTFPRRTDFVARYGGEEIAVVLQQDPLDVGRAMSERLLEAIRKLEIRFGEQTIRVTVSIGLAEFESGEDAKSWIERADKALYAAKHAGRDRLSIHGEPEEAVVA